LPGSSTGTRGAEDATRDRSAWRASEPYGAEVQVEGFGLRVGVEVQAGETALRSVAQDMEEQELAAVPCRSRTGRRTALRVGPWGGRPGRGRSRRHRRRCQRPTSGRIRIPLRRRSALLGRIRGRQLSHPSALWSGANAEIFSCSSGRARRIATPATSSRYVKTPAGRSNLRRERLNVGLVL